MTKKIWKIVYPLIGIAAFFSMSYLLTAFLNLYNIFGELETAESILLLVLLLVLAIAVIFLYCYAFDIPHQEQAENDYIDKKMVFAYTEEWFYVPCGAFFFYTFCEFTAFALDNLFDEGAIGSILSCLSPFIVYAIVWFIACFALYDNSRYALHSYNDSELSKTLRGRYIARKGLWISFLVLLVPTVYLLFGRH